MEFPQVLASINYNYTQDQVVVFCEEFRTKVSIAQHSSVNFHSKLPGARPHHVRSCILLNIYKQDTVGVKTKFLFTIRLSTVYRLNGNSFSCVFSVHTTDKLNMCSVISTS